MVYLPLFGKDSVPQSASRLIGLCSTVFLWLVVFVVLALINPKKEEKERYVTVQVVLSPEDHYIPKEIPIETVVGGDEGSAVEEESAPLPVVQTVAEAKTTAPIIKNPSRPKSTPQSNTSQASSKGYDNPSRAPVDYGQSVDDQIAAQLNGTKKAAVWDESMFQDTSKANTSTSSSNADRTINKETSFSGTAGTVSNANTNKTSTAKNNSTQTSQDASASTTDALKRIASASSYSASTDGSKTTTSMKTAKTSTGTLQIEMQDGSMRSLLEPLSPAIKLSPDAAKTIEQPKITVGIILTVIENGNVSQVSFDARGSVLSATVKDEIIDQIKKWRFESATFQSTAKFNYTIEKN